jgi:hypothetical protein
VNLFNSPLSYNCDVKAKNEPYHLISIAESFLSFVASSRPEMNAVTGMLFSAATFCIQACCCSDTITRSGTTTTQAGFPLKGIVVKESTWN